MVYGKTKTKAKVKIAKFSKGDKVFLEFSGKCDGKQYEIKSVRFNTLTRVFMYSFVGKSFCCSELNIKKSMSSKLPRLSDIMHTNDRTEELLDEGFIGNVLSMEGTRFGGEPGVLFFRPDREFVKWIVDYAAGRLIIDVGCGTGRITQELMNAGAKVIGIDPYFSVERMISINQKQADASRPTINFLSMEIQSCGKFLNKLFETGPGVLMLFARPCHSQLRSFVEAGIDMTPAGTESLYITVPKNFDKFDDLGNYRHQAKLIPHKGHSADNEDVYSIVKQ